MIQVYKGNHKGFRGKRSHETGSLSNLTFITYVLRFICHCQGVLALSCITRLSDAVYFWEVLLRAVAKEENGQEMQNRLCFCFLLEGEVDCWFDNFAINIYYF